MTNGHSSARQKAILIQSGGDINPVRKDYAEEFEVHGFGVEWRTFAETPPADRSIVVTVELKTSYLDSISEQNFDQRSRC